MTWLWGRGGRRGPRLIEPGEWGPRTGRARVLIEHPDGLQLWAEAEALREAGYDVAVCKGPDEVDGTQCPLVATGRCSLAEQADVVVSTPSLAGAREIVAALAERPAALVVEGPRPALERDGYAIDDARVLRYPVSGESLVATVSALRK